ncbi:MAG: hypothetical protein ABI051_14840 [Vicinamibacterales bacterium]
MQPTGTAEMWLGVIAIALSVMVLMLMGAAVAGFRLYRRISAAVELFERDQMAPIVRRLNTALDDVHDVLGRMKSADDHVRHALARTSEKAGNAASKVRAGFWPVVGFGRGVWAALASFRRRQPLPPGSGADGGEARFAYQGGTSHVRS